MIDALEEEAESLHSGMARLGLDALQGLEDAPIAGKHKKAGRRMSGMLFGKKWGCGGGDVGAYFLEGRALQYV